ncbi:MAG: hypothetical protein IT324_30420 [Anaerolineae bacterium]|nr:hypothetical protein [Anaerolineae bacterium]
MTTVHQSPEKAYQRYAWVILFLLGILLVVNIVVVAGVEDHVHEFQEDTGTAWNEFAAAYPSVADAYVQNQRLLFLCFASVALFAVIITYFGFRNGNRWAWYAMWLLPATLTVTTIWMIPARQTELPILYGGFTLVAVIGLLLPIRKFFPREGEA